MNTFSKKIETSKVLVPINTSELTSGAISVIGAPLVTKLEHRQSTSLGPNAIRRAIEEVFALFTNSSNKSFEDLDTGTKRVLNSEFCMNDLGDLPSNANNKSIVELFAFLSKKNVAPVILGGAREIGSWCSQAISELDNDCAIVHITPSILERDSLAGTATFFIGVNGLVPSKAWRQTKDHNNTCVSADQIHEMGAVEASELLLAFLKEQKRVFWRIDVSAVDTGHAAGTPTINIGGLDPEQILDILDLISVHSRFAGCALTNVAPVFDKRGLSEYFAAEALSRVIAPVLWDRVEP
jgi:agmatinase